MAKTGESFKITETRLIRIVKDASSSGSMCVEHSTSIAKLETKFDTTLPQIDSKIDRVLANQDKLFDRMNEVENDITCVKAEKKVITSVIGGASGVVGIIIGGIITYFTKKSGG